MIVVDLNGVARVIRERDPKDRRDPTNIPHLTVDQRGTMHCERCGATARPTDREVYEFKIVDSSVGRFVAAHKDCCKLDVC